MDRRTWWSEGRRLAGYGALGGYACLLPAQVMNLLTAGTPLGWQPISNTAAGTLAYLLGTLTLYPALGAAAGMLLGLAASLVRRRGEERRRDYTGAVLLLTAGLAGLPADWSAPTFAMLATSFLAPAAGAGLWVLYRRRPGLLERARRWAGGAAMLGVTLSFAVLFLFPPFPDSAPPTSTPGPNIIFVLSDAQRADDCSLYGGGVPTPNLERLAERGVTFENCYSVSNWTVPAVATLFSGLGPAVTGADSPAKLPANLPWLPEELQGIGYRTRALIHNHVLTIPAGFGRGFDDGLQVGRAWFSLGFAPPEGASLYAWLTYRLNRFLSGALHGYFDALIPEAGLRAVDDLSPGGGDFLYWHLFTAHAPYRPRPEFVEPSGYDGPFRFDSGEYPQTDYDAADREQLRRLYDGELREVDLLLGRLLDRLDRLGRWSSTAVIFTADHGEAFGEHGEDTHRLASLHPEVTRVPLVIWWPGVFEGGGWRDDPASLADLPATIRELTGIPGDPARFSGRSLVTPSPPGRTLFAWRDYDAWDGCWRSAFLLRGRAALFLDRTSGKAELYLDPPTCALDVAAEHPALVRELLGELVRREEQQAELKAWWGIRSGGGEGTSLDDLRAIGYLQ